MIKNGNRTELRRGDIVWVNLDPTVGSEIKKTRPGLIISNDAQNKVGKRFIVAPITSVVKTYFHLKALSLLMKNNVRQCLIK